jgi:hypothetical protein
VAQDLYSFMLSRMSSPASFATRNTLPMHDQSSCLLCFTWCTTMEYNKEQHALWQQQQAGSYKSVQLLLPVQIPCHVHQLAVHSEHVWHPACARTAVRARAAAASTGPALPSAPMLLQLPTQPSSCTCRHLCLLQFAASAAAAAAIHYCLAPLTHQASQLITTAWLHISTYGFHALLALVIQLRVHTVILSNLAQQHSRPSVR